MLCVSFECLLTVGLFQTTPLVLDEYGPKSLWPSDLTAAGKQSSSNRRPLFRHCCRRLSKSCWQNFTAFWLVPMPSALSCWRAIRFAADVILTSYLQKIYSLDGELSWVSLWAELWTQSRSASFIAAAGDVRTGRNQTGRGLSGQVSRQRQYKYTATTKYKQGHA